MLKMKYFYLFYTGGFFSRVILKSLCLVCVAGGPSSTY